MQAVSPYKTTVNAEVFAAVKTVFRDAIGAYFNPKKPEKIFVMTMGGGIDGRNVETIKRSDLSGQKVTAAFHCNA